MISAWDIYWVMQLDSIGCAFVFVAISLLVVAAGAAVGAMFNRDMRAIWSDNKEGNSFKEYDAKVVGWTSVAKKTAPIGLVVALLAAFIPSTKTAAMMLVIPAVANNEAIQREAGDLYGIAKDALRELAMPKNEQPSK